MEKVLAGYRVLDFGRYIAAPYCASLLAFMGAEVIRIERPGGSEDRHITPVTADGDGAMFMQMNANKSGMTLDIASPEGRDVVKKLVATADVVIANMPPKTLAALGLDYDSLCDIKPDIILTSNSTFGSTGPYANKVGFDGIAQAMSGASFFSGTPERPSKAAVQYVDFSTALAGTIGTLAAIMMHQKTGEGQQVETALLATALTIANGSLIEQAMTQANRQPTGNRAQVVAPSDICATKDGFIVIQIVGPYMFKRWARLLGKEEWLTDPRFATDDGRGEHADFLCGEAGRWCETQTSAEALAALETAKIPSGEVLSFQKALDHPYVQAMGHLHDLPYPGAERPAPVAQAPFKLSKMEMGLTKRAPTLGEHTHTILQELGYEATEIERFSEIGIV